jgi:hypothetical protein
MPDKEHLRQLAVLVDSGEATPEERNELEAGLAADPALAAEINELSRVDQRLRETAFQPAPMHPTISGMLERTRRDALSARTAAEARATGSPDVVAFESDANPAKADAPDSVPQVRPMRKFGRLAMAASISLLLVLGAVFFPREPKFPPIAVFAPTGETMHTRPTLVWDAQPDKLYNVWIISPDGPQAEAPVLFKAENKQSPLPFDQLEPTPKANGQELAPGQNYRVLICFEGAPRIAGTAVPFSTAAAAAGPPISGSLEKARVLAAAGRIGDAFMLLATAPDRDSPAGRALEMELRAKLPR